MNMSNAQAADSERTHQDLRNMRDAVVNALNDGDIDGLLLHLHRNIVFTAMNGEVCRGHDAMRAYFNRMMREPGHFVQSLRVNPTVERLTDLYDGIAGVAYGSSIDHYKLAHGQELEMHTRWTATMVKDNGVWQVASFQSAPNAFDNPLIDKVKTAAYWGVAGSGLIGVILGTLIGRRWKK